MKDRRMGTFRLRSREIEEEPELVRMILSGLIVVRAEMHYDFDGIEYLALGADFEEVPRHMMVPPYRWEVGEAGPVARRCEWSEC